jgi:hypothetical protein
MAARKSKTKKLAAKAGLAVRAKRIPKAKITANVADGLKNEKPETTQIAVFIQPHQPRSMMMLNTPEQLEKVTQNLSKSVEEMSLFAQKSWDVAMQSAAALTKGIDESSRHATMIAQESMDRLMSVGKTIMSAKSPREAMELHAEHVKQSFDHIVAGTGKLSEISVRVIKDVMEPVAQHTNDAVSTMMSKSRAA